MDLLYLNIDNFNFNSENKHQKQHKAGRYIIEYAAKNIYNIENPEIIIINKKPKFKYSDIQFSISHSNNIAAVCFDKYPLGFDIEHITNRNYIKIAKKLNFKMKENSSEEFYKLWTLYEAEIKLQNKYQYSHTDNFLNNYIFSIVSNNNFSIEKIKEIKQ